MATKLCAFFCGLAFLFFGICGLISRLVVLPPAQLRFYDVHVSGHWGFVFGWMPVNALHNIVYIVLGGLGLLSSSWYPAAKAYCRGTFFIALTFTIAGFLPFGIAEFWGLIPLFGWNVMFHTVLAIAFYYYGFIHPLDLEVENKTARAGVSS